MTPPLAYRTGQKRPRSPFEDEPNAHDGNSASQAVLGGPPTQLLLTHIAPSAADFLRPYAPPLGNSSALEAGRYLGALSRPTSSYEGEWIGDSRSAWQTPGDTAGYARLFSTGSPDANTGGRATTPNTAGSNTSGDAHSTGSGYSADSESTQYGIMFKLGNVVRGHGYRETGGREAVTAHRYAATSRGEDLPTNKRPRLSYPKVALGSNTEDKVGFHESNRKPEPRAEANRSGEACTNCRRAQMRCRLNLDRGTCERCQIRGVVCTFTDSSRAKLSRNVARSGPSLARATPARRLATPTNDTETANAGTARPFAPTLGGIPTSEGTRTLDEEPSLASSVRSTDLNLLITPDSGYNDQPRSSPLSLDTGLKSSNTSDWSIPETPLFGPYEIADKPEDTFPGEDDRTDECIRIAVEEAGPPSPKQAGLLESQTRQDFPSKHSETHAQLGPLPYSLRSIGSGVNSRPPPESASNDIVTSYMTLPEIISCLGSRGCANITDQLDPGSCSQYPISHGGFGDIFRGTLNDGRQVAIKTMRMRVSSDIENNKSLKHAAKELYTWSKCRHRNVQALLGLVEFRGQIGMVSLWEANGNLSDYIKFRKEADRCKLSAQVAEGLAYLHASGVVHGDLKASNVLVSESGVPLLADFGNATLQAYTLEFTNTSSIVSLSLRWAAPEVLKGTVSNSIPADIYALGMTILETITGRLPWFGKGDQAVVVAVMVMNQHPERPRSHMPDDSEHGGLLWSTLKSCWANEPRDRPSAAKLQDLMHRVTPKGLLPIQHQPTTTPNDTFSEDST